MEYVNALRVALASPVATGPTPLVQALQGFTLGSALLEFAPLLYVAVFPLLAAIFAVLGLCNTGGDRAYKFGARTVLRRVVIAVRAETRMGLETKHTALLKKAGFASSKGAPRHMQPTASALESGLARKSPVQSKAKKEEAAIKNKASPTKK